MGVGTDEISYAMDRYGNEREFCFNVKESEYAKEGPIPKPRISNANNSQNCIFWQPPLRLHGHLPHQLIHQLGKTPIRLHQLRLGAHIPIRHLPHAAEKRILEDPIRLIHPIAQLGRELKHLLPIPRDGRNLRHHDFVRLRELLVQIRDEIDGVLRVGAVIMHPQEIRRVARDAVHEIREPFLARRVAGARGPDEFLPLVLAQGEHFVVPDFGGVFGGNAGAFGLVEEEDDGFLAVLDVVPVAARKLAFEADHGAEGGAVFEFGGVPGVPVDDGGDGAFEVDLVDLAGDVAGVGPVWEGDFD